MSSGDLGRKRRVVTAASTEDGADVGSSDASPAPAALRLQHEPWDQGQSLLDPMPLVGRWGGWLLILLGESKESMEMKNIHKLIK